MKRIAFTFSLIIIFTTALRAQTLEDSLFIRKIFDEALTNGKCYGVLEKLCKNIGPRLTGMKGAYDAVDYMKAVMEEQGFDNVFLQEVEIPRWVRGNVQEAYILSKKVMLPVNICALGGSVATPKEGVMAEVIEVFGLEEIDERKDEIKGKIVFYNRPMDPRLIHTFSAYGGCVDQRYYGAAKAAKYGAKAVVVRSMTHALDDFPHTGSMGYDSLYPRIPAVAISTKGAKQLSSMLKEEPTLKFKYVIDSKVLPDTISHNVIGEIKGKRDNTYIIAGGHLDAWDNGEGAHDDGAGCVHSIEAVRLLKTIGYEPNHTLRSVMYMNEENGLRGGNRYADEARRKNERHLAAIESDRGGFTPRGFFIDFDEKSIAYLERFKVLLEPYGIHVIQKGGSGADIGPMKKDGVMLIGFVPDSQRYFDYHHASSDTFDKVNKRELELGAASIAAIIYLIDKYSDELFNLRQ
jgi:hypothetical protein